MINNYYLEAARHYELAAKSQTESHKSRQEGDNEKASQYARVAKAHWAQAEDYSNGAGKKHHRDS